jgi:DNA-binding response OmpR family regulator
MTSTYRALVVDDDSMAREATILAFQDEGFDCEWARDGAEAIAACKSSTFDVVLTDLRMPHRNGHSFIVELLKKADRPAIVVLTGVHEPRLAQDLIHRGVDDLMLKPVDYQLLTHKVKGLVSRRRAERNIGRPTTQADLSQAKQKA